MSADQPRFRAKRATGKPAAAQPALIGYFPDWVSPIRRTGSRSRSHPRGPRASGRRPREWPGHHRSSWYRRSAAVVTKRPGMPSTWSKWPCVNRSRSSLRKPAPLRSNWRWMPSPQSTRMRSLPASTRRPGWLRSADGMLADVPRDVRSNIVEKNPPLSTFGDGPRFALHICVDGAAGPRQLLPQGTADCMNSLMAFLR